VHWTALARWSGQAGHSSGVWCSGCGPACAGHSSRLAVLSRRPHPKRTDIFIGAPKRGGASRRNIGREYTSIKQDIATGTVEKARLKSTLVSWISFLGLGAVVIGALVSSLSPPRGPQSLGDVRLAISSDPDPPRLGLNRMEVRLDTTDRKPISGASVELKYGLEARGTLAMAVTQPAAEGIYRSDVEFDEPGSWQVILKLKRAGAPDLSATYLYNVAPSSGGGKVLAGTIRITPRLAGRIAPGDVLFVIARRGPGPPLAAKRIPSPVFPVSFRLGQEDVVMTGGSFQGEASVIARVKKGGAAGPAQPGDLEGAYPGNPVKIGGAAIEILIDREL